jgi:hypothetical protein
MNNKIDREWEEIISNYRQLRPEMFIQHGLASLQVTPEYIRTELVEIMLDQAISQAVEAERARLESLIPEIEKLKTYTIHWELPSKEVEKPRSYDVVYIRKAEAISIMQEAVKK